MREILFRGKRKDNGEWIEGYLVNARYYLDDSPTTIIIPTFNPYSDTSDPTLYPRCEISGCEEVNPETVGQYTDLTDKNRTKIFDGDIVVFNRGRKLPNTEVKPEVIFWDERNAQFARYVEYVRCGKLFCATLLLQKDMMPECEVIGNIHDNPELLKGGAEE